MMSKISSGFFSTEVCMLKQLFIIIDNYTGIRNSRQNTYSRQNARQWRHNENSGKGTHVDTWHVIMGLALLRYIVLRRQNLALLSIPALITLALSLALTLTHRPTPSCSPSPNPSTVHSADPANTQCTVHSVHPPAGAERPPTSEAWIHL
jgi:hypothetical protein